MFIGRRADGSIYGMWSVRQIADANHPGQEEVADDHPDVLAALAPTAAQIAEASRRAVIHDDPLRVDLLNRVKTATAAQISAYVDANVTDIATARALFKRILLLISLDARNGA